MESEAFIREAIDQVKSIEMTSKNIRDVYTTNTRLMSDITSDQDDILNSLSTIEKELDYLLSSGGVGLGRHESGKVLDFYNNPITATIGEESSLETAFYDKRLTR